MNREYEEDDIQLDPYYAVISFEDGKRFYDSHLWPSKKETEKFCKSHQGSLIHKGWEVKGREWIKADDLCHDLVHNINEGIIPENYIKKIEKLSDNINKLPDKF